MVQELACFLEVSLDEVSKRLQFTIFDRQRNVSTILRRHDVEFREEQQCK